MKKNFINTILLASLLCLISLSNCSHDENEGNHANTPPGAPGSEYPGNRSDSTGTMTPVDSSHH